MFVGFRFGFLCWGVGSGRRQTSGAGRNICIPVSEQPCLRDSCATLSLSLSLSLSPSLDSRKSGKGLSSVACSK